MRRSDAYRIVDGQTRLNGETLNRIFGDLDTRLDAVEKIRAVLDAEVNSLVEVGLARVNESLGPLIADVTAATELGFLIGQSESDVELIADQPAGLVISEANRAVFQPPPFLVAMVNSDVSKYAVVQRTAWDRVSGLLTVQVLFVHGGDPNIQSDDWTVAGSGGIVPLFIELGDQVTADKMTVAADKAIVAADKAIVAADKVTVAGYKDAAAASAAAAAASAIAADTWDPENYYTETEADAAIAAAIAAMVDSAPATLDTLNEIAAALGDDPDLAGTLTTAIAAKAPLASPTFTGTVTVSSGVLAFSLPNFYITEVGGINPAVVFDANDYLFYDRATDVLTLNIGGVEKWRVDANGNIDIAGTLPATKLSGFEDVSSALVALTDASPVAVDWSAGINFSLTVTTNRQLGNPTNVQVGTFRTITILGNSTTDRTITFGSNYKNVPTITDCDNARAYTLTLFARTATSIVVTAVGYAI